MGNRFVFKKYKDSRNVFDHSNVEFEVPAEERLDNVVEAFEEFLKGCGFFFHGLEVIYDESDKRDVRKRQDPNKNNDDFSVSETEEKEANILGVPPMVRTKL